MTKEVAVEEIQSPYKGIEQLEVKVRPKKKDKIKLKTYKNETYKKGLAKIKEILASHPRCEGMEFSEDWVLLAEEMTLEEQLGSRKCIKFIIDNEKGYGTKLYYLPEPDQVFARNNVWETRNRLNQ